MVTTVYGLRLKVDNESDRINRIYKIIILSQRSQRTQRKTNNIFIMCSVVSISA